MPRHRWAIDLGTGAGFTAFAMAKYSQRVLATDPTLPMLQQTCRGRLERRLVNLALSQNLAEALPVASDSIDLVTSRMAAHHFADLGRALAEVRRVLRVGRAHRYPAGGGSGAALRFPVGARGSARSFSNPGGRRRHPLLLALPGLPIH